MDAANPHDGGAETARESDVTCENPRVTPLPPPPTVGSGSKRH